MKKYILFHLSILMFTPFIFSQEHEGNKDNLPVREHTLIIRKEKVNKAGKEVMGMTVNGTIPGPTLEFKEGEYAVIYVKNEMDVETSIHWHGFLLPNYYDGVPYLTTPPIKSGTTFKYEFPIRQSGTYWYHSHTMLQEQSGVLGSIVIHPKEKELAYDKDLVLVLSDWTNEKPNNVMRNLKRGNEFYGIKKGTSTPLNQVIGKGALGAQLNFWRQRMEGADIADVYYPAFLVNGEESISYPDLKAGEKVRVRIINGGASTSFWLTFGGEKPILVSADGLNVEPVPKNKIFIAIAETYDFILTIPENGKIEFQAMAQDGSGEAQAYLGTGEVLSAEDIPRPNKIEMMQKMAKMDMKMGAPAIKFRPKKDERHAMMEKYGMQMEGMNDEKGEMNHENSQEEHSQMEKDSSKMKDMNHSEMDHTKMKDSEMKNMEGMDMDMFSEYNYNYLKAKEKTVYPDDVPVREILMNLTGNMNRYIWSINGVPLNETDNIKIQSNEVTRMTFNNLTMMHHPMHLHGHFFRVINKNGEYSPLKHTVNVAPMEKVTIEFYKNGGDENGDWFFHCHILYHMMSGMTRVISYDTPRDPRMKEYPVKKLIHEANQIYSWHTLDVASHHVGYDFVASNIRNQLNISAEYGWKENLEGEVTYERYLQDYFRVFGGVNFENETEGNLDEISTTAVAGIRYLTPFLFNLDVRIDNKLRPQISLEKEIMIFPRTILFGEVEYQANFGWVDEFEPNINYREEVVWNAGLEFLVSKNFSVFGSYDNRFGVGGGLSVRF